MLRKVAVEAAESLIEKLAARARDNPRSDPKSAQHRANLRREDAALAKRELTASGINAERLDALAAERAQSRRKLAEQARVRAVEASHAAGDRLRALTPVLPATPPNITIDEVTFIRSFAGTGVVSDSAIAPGENSAQYRFRSSDSNVAAIGRLSFFTLWKNANTGTKVVTAAARLLVNASLAAEGEWSGVAAWFGIGGFANATVRARTTLWALWNSALFATGPDARLGSVNVDGSFFGGDDHAAIAFNDLLPPPTLMVPKQAYVLIEVELLTDWNAIGGSIDLDAESGGFRVSVPTIDLTLT